MPDLTIQPRALRTSRSHTTLRVLACGGLLTVVSLLASACSGPHYQGSASGPKVGIVGDSITNLLRPELTATVGANYRYEVKARNGKRIDEQLGAVRSILDERDPPLRMIINLGTNDALQSRSDALVHLAQELEALAHVPCVILVTITPDADRGGSHVAAQLNAAMAVAVRSHPNFHLLDWAAMLAQDGNGKAWLSALDGIHPDPTGAAVLAGAYRHALDLDCAAVPSSPPD